MAPPAANRAAEHAEQLADGQVELLLLVRGDHLDMGGRVV